MAVHESLLLFGSGLLAGIILPLFMYGQSAVDRKKESCNQRLGDIIRPMAQKIEEGGTLEDIDRLRLYNVLEIYTLSEYHFGYAWKPGFMAGLLVIATYFSDLYGAMVSGIPLATITGILSFLAFVVFVVNMWQLMTILRRTL